MAANSPNDRATATYESFFGFREAPFSLAPNTRFRFDSASHRTALEQVTYALQRREPVVVVTGEIGTGKTFLCRTVVERLDRKTFLSTINDPRLGRDDLLKQMLQDFGIISTDRTKVAATSRADLIHALNEFLLTLARLDAHAIVIIDEAQHLDPDVLEEIRLLSNIQDERGTILQIILVGQTNLEELLTKPELQQLKQRVSRYVHLESMSADEVAQYIAHRLAVAREGPGARTPGARELEQAIAEWQGSTLHVAFTPEAIQRIAQLSRGVPRVVNLLCDRALEAAYASESYAVDDRLIDGAARALDLQDVPPAEAAAAAPAPSVADSFWATPTELPSEIAVEPPRADSRVGEYAGLAVAVVVALIAIWFGVRALTGNPATEPATANPTAPAAPPSRPSAPAPESSAPSSPAPTTPAKPTPPPSAAATAPAATGTSAGSAGTADTFEIVVASFRTEARANAVAAEVGALGVPVRQREANGWQQVLAGPFRSRPQADDAQQRLARAGFTNTQVVPASR